MDNTVDFTIQAWHIYCLLTGLGVVISAGCVKRKLHARSEWRATQLKLQKQQTEQEERDERYRATCVALAKEETQQRDLGLWWDTFKIFRDTDSQSARVVYLRKLTSQLDPQDTGSCTLSAMGLKHFAIETGTATVDGVCWRREITSILEPFVNVDASALIVSAPISAPISPSTVVRVNSELGVVKGCDCVQCEGIREEEYERIARKNEPPHCDVCHIVLLRGEHRLCPSCEIPGAYAPLVERETNPDPWSKLLTMINGDNMPEAPAVHVVEQLVKNLEGRNPVCISPIIFAQIGARFLDPAKQGKVLWALKDFIDHPEFCDSVATQSAQPAKPRKYQVARDSLLAGLRYKVEPWWQDFYDRLARLASDAPRQAVLYAVLKTIEDANDFPMTAETYQKFIDLFGNGYKIVPEANLQKFVTDEKAKVERKQA